MGKIQVLHVIAILLSPAEWEVLARSVGVASVAVLMMLPLGTWLGYRLARGRLRFSFVIENLVQLPLVLPPVVTGYALLLLVGPGSGFGRAIESVGLSVAFTWFGAALAASVVAFPLFVNTVRVAFEQIDPEIEEAGYVFGGTKWSVLRLVTIPLAARGILAGVALAFGRALGEFGATIVLAGNIPGKTATLPLAIYTEINRADGAVMRLVIITVCLSVIVMIAYSVLMRRLHSPAKEKS